MLNIFNLENMSKGKKSSEDKKSSEGKMTEDDERPEWDWIKRNRRDLD